MASSSGYSHILNWSPRPSCETSRSCREHDQDGVLQLFEPPPEKSTIPTYLSFNDLAVVDPSLGVHFSRLSFMAALPSSSPFFEIPAPISTSPIFRWSKGVNFDLQYYLYTYLLSPISRLPDELLGQIFHEFVMSFPWVHSNNTTSEDGSSKRQLAPFSLMQICSRWRNVCISTSKLWVYHHVPLSKFSSSHQSQRDPFESYINLTHYTRLALFRSKGCPLHVHITILPANPVAAAAGLLFDVSHRWQSAYIAIGSTSTSAAPCLSARQFLTGLRYPILEELTLEYDSSGSTEEQVEYCLPSFVRSPKLHTLRVVKMRWWPAWDSQSESSNAVLSDIVDGINGDLDHGDRGEVSEGEIERRPLPHLPYSQIRILTGSASLPTLYALLKLCSNLETVEVEQERFPALALPPPAALDLETAVGRVTLGASPTSQLHHNYSHIYDWNSTFTSSTTASFDNGFLKNIAIDVPHLRTLSVSLATDQPPLTNWIRRTPSLRTLSLTGGKLTSKVVHDQVVNDMIGFLHRQRFFSCGGLETSSRSESFSGLENFTLSTVEITSRQLIELFTHMPELRQLKLGRHAWGPRSYLGELRGEGGEVLRRLRVPRALTTSQSKPQSTFTQRDIASSECGIKKGKGHDQCHRILLPRLTSFSLYFPRPPVQTEFEELLDVLESRAVPGTSGMAVPVSVQCTAELSMVKFDVDIPGGLAMMLEQSDWASYRQRVLKVVGMSEGEAAIESSG
ncbi:hypothetical protein GGU11DRAFT_853618 [Lentinula aff. detonsa]|nr:hypothetical protein GGU11DRAFT_853618 [Lentinula aff. detonsa]